MPDATKDRIIDATTLLIQESGIDALSMDAAADAAGVSRKTVYNYFDNKFTLAEEVANQWIYHFLTDLASIVNDPTLDFVTKINLILSRGFAKMHLGNNMLRPRQKLKIDRRINEMKRELRERLRLFIQQIVQEAHGSHLIRQEFETKRLAWIFINIVEGFLLIDEFEDIPFSKIDLLKDSLRAVIRGILSEQGFIALQDSPIFSTDGYGSGEADSLAVQGGTP
ncbi:MAG: hypothetical protein A2087_06820 [Spirochaetes bacterium GWD1_61_31]|nr:MAG: hypothetical protein A2Y37_08650 [Spirochaetes bacterium GWB1_60_80]OHD31843.1 MAG: hypothetical protein A2004_10025 [Spirochaetes bacterium GWC1_61_12]OHD40061.1 MAG: hypothetical protein A2087_06820 [Spirochaetes bacterium GWD1_61_31]OHD45890.1 MAG: hypothetical protein A2Y35_04285 [Spirochaetes bacterium GWE1_60_18]OHD58434.1 MAG: hypothetical protein A2Y32_06675 [Spirochaetes bacterium GWF1_60_12]